METIKHKFKPDDLVYYRGYEKTVTSNSCPMCEGTGVLFAKSGAEWKCNFCHGDKTIITGESTREVVKQGEINSVHIAVLSYNTTISYKLKDDCNTKHFESNLFDVYEDAEKTLSKDVSGWSGTTGSVGVSMSKRI